MDQERFNAAGFPSYWIKGIISNAEAICPNFPFHRRIRCQTLRTYSSCVRYNGQAGGRKSPEMRIVARSQLMTNNRGANAGGYCHRSGTPASSPSAIPALSPSAIPASSPSASVTERREVWFSDEFTPRYDWSWSGNFYLSAALRSYCWFRCTCQNNPQRENLTDAVIPSRLFQVLARSAFSQNADGSINLVGTGSQTSQLQVLPPQNGPNPPAGSCGTDKRQFCDMKWPAYFLGSTLPQTPPDATQILPAAAGSHNLTQCGSFCHRLQDCGGGPGIEEGAACKCVDPSPADRQRLASKRIHRTLPEATWQTVPSLTHLNPLLLTRYLPSLDHDERTRKRLARSSHKASESARSFTGLRAKLYAKKRHAEKIQMRKQIKAHEEKNLKTTTSTPQEPSSTPLPQYLLDRTNPQTNHAKTLSTAIKSKRAEKAAKYSVPLPRVKGISEEEMFRAVKTGKKTAKKSWKRLITKPTFVPPNFTRRPVKYERFIRPMGLRYKKAHVTHPELKVT
ncbi:MAG: hypothetical protein Q9212_006983, partial [Teloschistes hypoglaucus]